MQIWLGVRNFAKIEEAKVHLGKYVLFVGQNNSGKTFLMQLIQGVIEKLPGFVDEGCLKILLDEERDTYRSYVISQENSAKLTAYLNKKLQAEKETIVKDIFQKEIPIGALYIEVQIEADRTYKIFLMDREEDFKDHMETILEPDKFLETYESFRSMPVDKICVSGYVDQKKNEWKPITLSGAFPPSKSDNYGTLVRRHMRYILGSESLFFPASRTGLLLLYREFFLNKTDRTVSYQIDDDQALEKGEDYGGLTKPVYQFLRFLQAFSENESKKKSFENELRFFEDHVINGHISADKQRTFLYSPKNGDGEVPMYLASSMINEVAPLAMALSGGEYYDRLIVDEVESSIHPQKQFELARFFNRLSRRGRTNLLISTHSDTFVSKMNNLYILSQYHQKLYRELAEFRDGMGLKTDRQNIFGYLESLDAAEGQERLARNLKRLRTLLEELDLTTQDLIDPASLLVYEFVLQENGKSVVKEIPGDAQRGFQFDSFAGSAVRLYDEALKIGELLE